MDDRDAKSKRPITCLESGVTYDSAYRAAKELGFADSRNIFRSIQRGTCTQGLHFYYADEPKPAPEFFIPPNRAPRPVVCLDTGETFESAFQAGRGRVAHKGLAGFQADDGAGLRMTLPEELGRGLRLVAVIEVQAAALDARAG